jgi:MMPL family
VVASAAVVMVGVFSIFGTLSLLMFKHFGVGLAAAILIDATVVRGVLLPATMKLLGERNWYLPRWLEWLPRFGARRAVGGARGEAGSVCLTSAQIPTAARRGRGSAFTPERCGLSAGRAFLRTIGCSRQLKILWHREDPKRALACADAHSEVPADELCSF